MADNFYAAREGDFAGLPHPTLPRLRERVGWGLRHGKGDHEIWHGPITNRRFMVDNNIKSRHWANYTLKQAGLPKAF
jgi:hypothetical protein